MLQVTRNRLAALVLAVAALNAGAEAGHAQGSSAPKPAKWFTFHTNVLHVSLRFPPDWRIISTSPATSRQITLYTTAGGHSLMISALPFRPGATLGQTMAQYLAYEQKTTHSPMYRQTRWTSTSVGGRPAMAGVLRAPTEGGTPISDAVYLTQWRGDAIQIVLFANHKPALSQLSQFPRIYFQILGTLRFV